MSSRNLAILVGVSSMLLLGLFISSSHFSSTSFATIPTLGINAATVGSGSGSGSGPGSSEIRASFAQEQQEEIVKLQTRINELEKSLNTVTAKNLEAASGKQDKIAKVQERINELEKTLNTAVSNSLKGASEKQDVLAKVQNRMNEVEKSLNAVASIHIEGKNGGSDKNNDSEKVSELQARIEQLKKGIDAVKQAERSPALHILGDAPKNIPSTVSFEPDESRKKAIYDGATDAQHLGGSIKLDTDGVSAGLWNFLMKAINVKSVVDVGCGRGVSTSWFMSHGADVLCVEGSNDAISKSYLPREKIVAHDFYQGPYWPNRTFDLAWSIEVLEHISREHMANYQSIFHKSAIIIASHSLWGGHHHVETHMDWWWVGRMELAGFQYSDRLTKMFRKIAATLSGHGGSHSQHLVYTTHVYLNPKVGSLPEHAHLFGMFGCFDGNSQKQEVPCEIPSDDPPASFLPVHRTPTHWDIFKMRFDVNVGSIHGDQSEEVLFDLSNLNLPGAKCRDEYPYPTPGDGCAFIGKPFNKSNGNEYGTKQEN